MAAQALRDCNPPNVRKQRVYATARASCGSAWSAEHSDPIYRHFKTCGWTTHATPRTNLREPHARSGESLHRSNSSHVIDASVYTGLERTHRRRSEEAHNQTCNQTATTWCAMCSVLVHAVASLPLHPVALSTAVCRRWAACESECGGACVCVQASAGKIVVVGASGYSGVPTVSALVRTVGADSVVVATRNPSSAAATGFSPLTPDAPASCPHRPDR